jgi:chromosome segregation ATPase
MPNCYSQVRSDLEEAKLRVEEGGLEISQLKRTVQQRDQVIGTKSSDFGEANAELKNLLAKRDEVAKIRHTEHEQSIARLEAVIAQQRQEAHSSQKATLDIEQALRQELRLKDRLVQGQIAEKDATINDLNSRLVATKAELVAAQENEGSSDDVVPSAELDMLSARLAEITSLYESTKEEADETAAEYQRALQERTQSEEARLATERGNRLAVERAKTDLEANLESASSSLKKARLDHQRKSAESAKESVEFHPLPLSL